MNDTRGSHELEGEASPEGGNDSDTMSVNNGTTADAAPQVLLIISLRPLLAKQELCYKEANQHTLYGL